MLVRYAERGPNFPTLRRGNGSALALLRDRRDADPEIFILSIRPQRNWDRMLAQNASRRPPLRPSATRRPQDRNGADSILLPLSLHPFAVWYILPVWRFAIFTFFGGNIMLFKSALVTQISGSIGGMTGSHNRGGLYLRARTIPVNPNTAAQILIRAAFGGLVNRWTSVLTQIQRDAWDIYAINTPLLGPLGDPVTVSGQNMYIRDNTPRVMIGATTIDTAPAIFNTGSLSLVSVVSAIAATQDVTFNFNNADLWNVVGGHLIVQQSRPQNPSINFFKGPYRFMNSFAGILVGDVTGPAVFPFLAGQALFFRVRASFADSRLTASQFIGPVIATA